MEEAAGQEVMHYHCQVISRDAGDVKEPGGGGRAGEAGVFRIAGGFSVTTVMEHLTERLLPENKHRAKPAMFLLSENSHNLF